MRAPHPALHNYGMCQFVSVAAIECMCCLHAINPHRSVSNLPLVAPCFCMLPVQWMLGVPGPNLLLLSLQHWKALVRDRERSISVH